MGSLIKLPKHAHCSEAVVLGERSTPTTPTVVADISAIVAALVIAADSTLYFDKYEAPSRSSMNGYR